MSDKECGAWTEIYDLKCELDQMRESLELLIKQLSDKIDFCVKGPDSYSVTKAILDAKEEAYERGRLDSIRAAELHDN